MQRACGAYNGRCRATKQRNEELLLNRRLKSPYDSTMALVAQESRQVVRLQDEFAGALDGAEYAELGYGK